MKILLVGVCDNEESTNYHQMVALRAMGHEVQPFNYRTEANAASARGDTEGAAQVYRDVFDAFKPELVIFSKFDTWPTEAIRWSKSHGALTWYWYMDPLLFLTRGLVEHAKAADFVSCTGLGQTQFLRFWGANAYHIFEGINPDTYYPVEPSEELNTEVGFIGSKTDERLELMRKLREADLDVTVSGPGWGETSKMMGAEFYRLMCASARLMVGCDREIHTLGYFSDRVFRVMACGGVYVSRRIPLMESWFEDGKHLFLFDKDRDLVDFCVSAAKCEDLRDVREAARQHVIQNFTWRHSMERLVSIVNGETTNWTFDLAPSVLASSPPSGEKSEGWYTGPPVS